MRCVVLGSSGSRPGNGQPCSGYLVEHAGTRVLLDCGFGVASALTGHCPVDALDAVFVTHRHLDHCIDLLGLYAVLRRTDAVLPVHAARDVEAVVSAAITPSRLAEWRARLPFAALAPGTTVQVGSMAVTAFASDHSVPTVSLRCVAADGSVLAYSSDSGGGADLLDCVRGADVALVEASWQSEGDDHSGDGHMTARRAGEIARDGGVERLVLSHLRPHLDPDVSVAEAATAYGGPIDVARSGVVLPVAAGLARSGALL